MISKLKNKDIKEAGDKDYNLLTFSWDLIDICQYKCTYCSAVNFNLHTFNQKKYLHNKWKLVLKKLGLKGIGCPFNVELLGGEPTLHPYIYNIIEGLGKIDNCIAIDLITNLAKPTKFYKELDKECNRKLTLEASYHPQYCNQRWIDKVVELNESKFIKIFPNVNLPTDRNDWDKTLDLLEQFKNKGVGISLNFLQTVDEGKVGGWVSEYPDDFFNVFKEHLTEETGEEQRTTKKLIDNLVTPSGKNNSIKFLKEHAGKLTTNIRYIDKNNNKHILTESDINRYDLAQFRNWNCKPLMYHIDMAGKIANHCTEEEYTIIDMKMKKLTKCVECPLQRCNCDTKFLYYKTSNEK